MSSSKQKVELAAGACLLCEGSCSGFQPHSWRKACTSCGCSSVDHVTGSEEEDRRMGRLLSDSPFSHMTSKVKGGGGLRLYKRNRLIVTNPQVSGKDPSFITTAFAWAPGAPQRLAVQFMELLPADCRPVCGTQGALWRSRQLQRQLPVHDQDPLKCSSLCHEDQIYSMLLFVKKYKQEVLGVGEVALPGEGGVLREAANQRAGKEPEKNTTSTNGTEEYTCSRCHGAVQRDSPVVFAQREGYGALWHPSCFCCSVCGLLLVDLVYFWTNQTLLCGRHYCESQRPRCQGCDELIFSESYHTTGDGRTWHLEHYCCWKCGQSLDLTCAHSAQTV